MIKTVSRMMAATAALGLVAAPMMANAKGPAKTGAFFMLRRDRAAAIA